MTTNFFTTSVTQPGNIWTGAGPDFVYVAPGVALTDTDSLDDAPALELEEIRIHVRTRRQRQRRPLGGRRRGDLADQAFEIRHRTGTRRPRGA